MGTNYQEWSSCEMHGHLYDDGGRCEDCGEEREL